MLGYPDDYIDGIEEVIEDIAHEQIPALIEKRHRALGAGTAAPLLLSDGKGEAPVALTEYEYLKKNEIKTPLTILILVDQKDEVLLSYRFEGGKIMMYEEIPSGTPLSEVTVGSEDTIQIKKCMAFQNITMETAWVTGRHMGE